MTKNIIIISSTPRKGGNSDILCDEFLKGAEKAGHNAKKIFLNDKNINYCTGCLDCVTKNSCSQNDDMGEIIKQILKADVLVFTTPVYFYTMSGQLKTFIDRCCAGYTQMRDLDLYFITSASAPYNGGTVDGIKRFTDCLVNCTEKLTIHAPATEINEIKSNEKIMKEAYNAGLNC
ncbi:MAG: flavodoxin family protein [Methanobacteriaceae archaeon]|nr:flavodoxin family protein [Methanobacteriaceae archaeon]